jgi:hypothetical protein
MARRGLVRRRITVGLLAIVAAAALWWGLPSPGALWQRALALPGLVWAGAAAGMALSYTLRAARLSDEWSGRVPAGWRDGLYITLMHSAAINVLPLRAGELGYPWLLYRRWGVAPADSAASLFWLRVQDAIVLGAWAFVVFGPGAGAPLLAARAACAVLLLALVARHATALAAWALRHPQLSGGGGGSSGIVRQVLQRLMNAARHAHPRGWLWASANWTVKLAVLALLMHTLMGIATVEPGAAALSAEQAAAAALGGEVAAVLPLQPPAGFGTYEAGVWAGARLAGAAEVDGPQLLGAAFTVHLFVIGCSLAGALASLLLQGQPRPLETPP